ncbi:MAG TPA: hypothetical protein VGB85_16200 [Nannocystis sp.]|jgi:hypothetical protein
MLRGIAIGRLLSWCCLTGFVAAFACGNDDGDTNEYCEPGNDGCACLDGTFCFDDRECIEDKCRFPGIETTSATSEATHATTPTSGDSAEDEGGQTEVGGDSDGFCEASAECGPEQVCSWQYQCGSPLDSVYLLLVKKWVPNDCQGIGDDLVYYKVKVDGVVAATSGETACPGEWGSADTYRPEWALEIELWRTNGSDPDSVVTRFCFLDAADECTQVPAAVLHDGGFTGPAGDSFVDISIAVDYI